MYYFAYGSNMSESRMKARALFTTREAATLPGYRLEFNKLANADPRMGFANIVPDENSTVEGVLYVLEDDALRKLDISEGYPEHYTREEIQVTGENSGKVTAQVYIAAPVRTRKGLKPSGQYLRHLLTASDLLSDAYCEWLQSLETFDSNARGTSGMQANGEVPA